MPALAAYRGEADVNGLIDATVVATVPLYAVRRCRHVHPAAWVMDVLLTFVQWCVLVRVGVVRVIPMVVVRAMRTRTSAAHGVVVTPVFSTRMPPVQEARAMPGLNAAMWSPLAAFRPVVAEYFPPTRADDGVNLGTVVPDSPVLAAEISRLLPTLEPLLVDFTNRDDASSEPAET